MSTLAADKPRTYETGHDEYLNGLPIVADDCVYSGSATGELNDTGTYRPLVSGDKFGGFCTAKTDNTGGAASALNVPVKEAGCIVLSVAGASSAADRGKRVYMTDDDTPTLTVGGSSIGHVHRWVSGTQCVVKIETFASRRPIAVTFAGQTTEAATDRTFFVADRPYYVASITCSFAVAAGGASKLQVSKDTATDSPGAGTDLLTDNTASGFDLNAAANTVQYGTVSTVAGVRKLAKGDRLALDFANTIQSTAGLVVTVKLIPL